jgi:protein-serine/threonine kinase
MQNYEMIRQLGSGNFGTVFLIRKKKSSKLFALKRLSKKLVIENKMKKYAYAEREILKNIKHPFILHASSFFQDPIYLYMVMDFCAGGDLEKQVRKAKFSE